MRFWHFKCVKYANTPLSEALCSIQPVFGGKNAFSVYFPKKTSVLKEIE
jgi:hypothetical protein